MRLTMLKMLAATMSLFVLAGAASSALASTDSAMVAPSIFNTAILMLFPLLR